MSADSRIRPVAKFFFDGDKKFFVKGVTYGPFKPDAEGNYLGRPDQVDKDLALMRQVGVNVVRIYHAPSRWFLDRCAAAGLPGRRGAHGQGIDADRSQCPVRYFRAGLEVLAKSELRHERRGQRGSTQVEDCRAG